MAKRKVTSISVVFGIKASTKFQSHPIIALAQADVDNPDDNEIAEHIKEMILPVIKGVQSSAGAYAKKNPTFAACLDNYKSVGKQYKKLKESEEEDG